MVTCCDPPAAIVPFVKLATKILPTPPVTVIPLTVSVEFPLFVIVSVDVAVFPTRTSPKTRFPLNPIIRVGVVVGVGDGDVVALFPLPQATAASSNVDAQARFSIALGGFGVGYNTGVDIRRAP